MRKRRKFRTSAPVVIISVITVLAALLVLKYVFDKNKPAGKTSSDIISSQSENNKSSSAEENSAVSSKTKVDTKAGSLLMLANKDNLISKNWEPELTTVPKSFYYSTSKDNRFDTRAAKSLEDFVSAGRKAGFSDLCILSGFRTYKYQQENFDRHVAQYIKDGKTKEEAETETAKIVAPAGTSEHETGLAADIISKSWYNKNGSLTADFDETEPGKWLVKNSAEYGFILRYPKDKVAETGYSYESWHFRYVGVNAAKVICEKGLSLEKYIENGGK